MTDQPKRAAGTGTEAGVSSPTLLRAVALPVFLIQEHGLTFMNPAAERLSGFSGGELAGQAFWRLLHSDCRQAVRRRLNRLLATGKGEASQEALVVTRGGEPRWVDLHLESLSWNGAPALLATAYDTTSFKKAQEELIYTEQRLNDLINFLPDPTFAIDRQGRLIAWNRAMEDLSGVPAYQMLGKANYEYALPFYGERRPVLLNLAMQWDPEVVKRYPELTRQQNILLAEVYIPDFGEEGIYLWTKASPIFDSQGNVAGAIETVRDISERKRLEEALKASAEKHKALVHSLPVGVIGVDREFRITELNARGEEITGFSQAEVVGRYCWQVLRGQLCGDNCPIRLAHREPSVVKPVETTLVTKSGLAKPIRLSAARLRDAHGQVVGGVEVFQDISEIKALERERANIVSMFAHDMKSPLVSIQGFVLRLMSKSSDTTLYKRDKYLEIIRKEAGKLESLIDDFLDFSRLETGSLKLNLAATDLDKEFLELVEVLEPRFAQAGVGLVLEGWEKLPVIQADAPRLRRVFLNLLENALKYTAAGAQVSISLQETPREIMVQIADQGAGIPPEELPFIFDLFYRGARQDGRQGHGLGLAGVEAIVKGHGGRVLVSSELGRGSVFTVALPKAGFAL